MVARNFYQDGSRPTAGDWIVATADPTVERNAWWETIAAAIFICVISIASNSKQMEDSWKHRTELKPSAINPYDEMGF